MVQSDIRHVPIIDNKEHVLGIITERDILLAQESASDNKTIDSNAIEQYMHTQISTISSRAGLKEAALYMQKHHIGCLPVLHEQKIIGIITDSDFVSIAINLMELQDEVEPVGFDETDDFDDIDTVLDELDELDSLDLDNIAHDRDELI